MRSINAECIGSAYMSGSLFRDQRRFVRSRAITSDAKTYFLGGSADVGTSGFGTHCTTEENNREKREQYGELQPSQHV